MNVEALEEGVRAAAESVLGARAHVAGRLDFGNVNSVYRVEAAGRAEAIAGFRVRDYAGLTYWYAHMRGGGGGRNDAEADEARDVFFRAYGEPGLDDGELRELEWTRHVTMAAGEMSYLYKVGDAPGYARSRALLLNLLDAQRGTRR